MHTLPQLPADGAVKKGQAHMAREPGSERVPAVKTHLEAVRPPDTHMPGFLRTITRGVCCIAVVNTAVASTATRTNVMSQQIVLESEKESHHEQHVESLSELTCSDLSYFRLPDQAYRKCIL